MPRALDIVRRKEEEIPVSSRDLEAALFGFHVARQEMTDREERFRALLEGHTNGRAKISRPPKVLPAQVEAIVPLPSKMPTHPDGTPVYRTNPNGSIKIGRRGLPLKRPYMSLKARKLMSARMKKGSALGEKVRVARGAS